MINTQAWFVARYAPPGNMAMWNEKEVMTLTPKWKHIQKDWYARANRDCIRRGWNKRYARYGDAENTTIRLFYKYVW